jgi:general secretion pathway protein G
METPRNDAERIARARRSSQAGMTIIELLATLAIASSLASIAIPKYHQIAETARTTRAIGDIQAIETTLDTKDTLPDLLITIGQNITDPWGNPYVYVKFPSGAPRVDRFGVQVNTTYDLYSMGPDAMSSNSLNAGSSFDDVVRANDGGFIGLGGKY